jgi:hypothetical protein
LATSGPTEVAQNCGNRPHAAYGLAGAAAGPNPTDPDGSLPKVLHGLPKGAGPVNSATLVRVNVCVENPKIVANVLSMVLDMVTWS